MLGLLTTVAVGPWLEGLGARIVLYVLEISAFASAIYAVRGSRRYTIALLCLGTAALALSKVALATGSQKGVAFALCLFVAFGLFTLVPVLSYVVWPGPSTANKLYGALSVYLLAGFTWGGMYAIAELLHPGSFQWSSGRPPAPNTLLESFVYLSFVTIATLGYGDIVPVTPEARSLAMLESIFGTFYVVVIIARLVAGFEGASRATPTVGGS
jgi:hypothetical protein